MIKALGTLEDDIDSLDSKVADMKRQLSLRTQKEIDTLLEKTQEMATAEAEEIIKSARTKATAEAKKITAQADSQLKKIQSNIDAGFDDAVRDVVDIILKS